MSPSPADADEREKGLRSSEENRGVGGKLKNAGASVIESSAANASAKVFGLGERIDKPPLLAPVSAKMGRNATVMMRSKEIGVGPGGSPR